MEAETLDQLIEFASDVLAKRKPYEPVTIVGKTLAFQTRIEGESWGNYVDARMARYVLSLQDAFDDLLADFPPDMYPEKAPRVRVTVEKGSSIPWAEISDFAKSIITPMTPEQSFIAAMAATASIAGYFYWSRWLKHKEQVQQNEKTFQGLAEHERTKLAMVGTLQAFAENTPEKFLPYERPPRQLVNSMEPEDQIFFVGEGAMTQDEARKSAPRRLRRTEEQTSYADGEYALKSINYTEGEPVLHLFRDGVEVKAYISELSEEDAKALLDGISQRQLSEELPMNILVQANIRHTARRIKYASIVGSGVPRTDRKQQSLGEISAQLAR